MDDSSSRDAESIGDAERVTEAKLRDDAEHAWRFFTQGDSHFFGMVPATILEGSKPDAENYIVDMWDVGSTVQATVSAAALGLIDEAELRERAEGILSFLHRATFTFGKSRLPNFRTSARSGSIVEPGFDSTDGGRLLIALRTLDRLTQGSLAVKDLVAGWDIGSTVSHGTIRDITGGKAYPATSYTYANYISRAFSLWDIDHKLPFPEQHASNEEEAANAVLQRVRKIGAFGTEPSVTEEIEMGSSEYATILAETLYAAQEQRYKASGVLTCVTETPIDREPWFTYQGYKLHGEGGEWTVDAADDDEKWANRAFAESARMVSTKGAFMWLAVRPDDYARTLYEYVVDRTRTDDIGFTAGVYEKNKRTVRVADINTNAMILESLAYILQGRKPLIEIVA